MYAVGWNLQNTKLQVSVKDKLCMYLSEERTEGMEV